MGWAKFDDRWATHPKLLAAGATPSEVMEAKGLDASGITWCAGQETDGFVPDSALIVLCAGHRGAKAIAERLVAVGRWLRDDERKGYLIHDYLTYNQSRADAEAKRQKERDRKASGRNTQGRDELGRVTSARNPAGSDATSGRNPHHVPPVVRPPVPTRPDLTTDSSSSNHHRVAPVENEEEEDPRIQEALDLLAGRRLMARQGPPITDPPKWMRTTIANLRADYADELRALCVNGTTPEAMAEAVEPSPRSDGLASVTSTLAPRRWVEDDETGRGRWEDA